MQAEQEQEEIDRAEERQRREEEETAKLAAERTLSTQLQRIPPTGRDIVPFRTYDLPSKQEVLDCPRSKVLHLVPMIDPIKGETNLELRMALEYKRTRDFYLKHA